MWYPFSVIISATRSPLPGLYPEHCTPLLPRARYINANNNPTSPQNHNKTLSLTHSRLHRLKPQHSKWLSTTSRATPGPTDAVVDCSSAANVINSVGTYLGIAVWGGAVGGLRASCPHNDWRPGSFPGPACWLNASPIMQSWLSMH